MPVYPRPTSKKKNHQPPLLSFLRYGTSSLLRTLPCYAAARLSRCFSRSYQRSLGECPHYIAIFPSHSGGRSSHRLCSSAAAIGLFANQWPCSYTALFKKRLQYRRKGVSPSVVCLRRSTCSVSQGIEVTLVTDYVYFPKHSF